MRKRKGFTLVEIMIVVAIIALLAAIAIPNLLRSRVNANEAAAQATLKTIATAAESYVGSEGEYPTAMADLTGATPPYLNENYTTNPPTGYSISCTFNDDGSGYDCTATPDNCGTTGTKDYGISTGAVMDDPADCT